MEVRSTRFSLAILATLVVVGIPIGILSWQQFQVTSPAIQSRHLDSEGKLRPEIELLKKLRTARLQTHSVNSTVMAEATDPSWRGETRAIVEFRVRYTFGIDLKELKKEQFQYLPGKKLLMVTIPRPMRAFEFPDVVPVREDVEVGWLRFRSYSGVEQLLVAREKICFEAERKVIPEAELKPIEHECLETVKVFIQGLVSDRADVQVKYQ